jgi:hypothetical protein
MDREARMTPITSRASIPDQDLGGHYQPLFGHEVVQVAIARNMTLEQANWGALFASASSAVRVAMVPLLFLQRYYIRVVATQAER